ncbi:toxin [Pseudomonas sp. NPDC089996]|uniref:toxin n=1 Tax=Pseudomonas sp. NPDC089996 TaxID=3364474 RepID=UPI00382AF433
MDAIFVELPPFERYRADLLSEEQFRCLQQILLSCPDAGDVIKGTGGLRKIRFSDPLRNKGKRGGIRVIYYYWHSGLEFWLFTLYGKDIQDDLTDQQRKALKRMLEREHLMRTRHAAQSLH